MQLLRVAWALAGAALCCALLLLLHSRLLKEGQLAAGTCEIVTLDRDSSQPRRTIARQTARCACKKGQIAGTTRARPACVDARIVRTKQWCDMVPCLEDEGCDLLVNRSGWTCTQPGGRVKTTTTKISPWSRADNTTNNNNYNNNYNNYNSNSKSICQWALSTRSPNSGRSSRGVESLQCGLYGSPSAALCSRPPAVDITRCLSSARHLPPTACLYLCFVNGQRPLVPRRTYVHTAPHAEH